MDNNNKLIHSLQEVNKSELTNRISDWIYSPRHPLLYQGKNYVLLGRKLNTLDSGSPDEICITKAELLDKTYTFPLPKEVVDQVLVVKKSDVTSQSSNYNSPWHRPNVQVFRSAAFTAAMNKILQETASGLSITFLQLCDLFIKKGIPIFVTGGAVRDVLIGKMDFKDVDFAFGCPSNEFVQICTAAGCLIAHHSAFGLVKLGNENARYAEGKCIMGVDSDAKKTHTNIPYISCTDLADEPQVRDWTINSMYYDIVNNVIVDPCKGIEHLKANGMVSTVDPSLWEYWLNGNPRKLFNFFKFASKGFAFTPEMKDFMITRASQMEAKYGLNSSLSQQYKRLGIIGKKKGAEAKAAEERFDQKLRELMPPEWVVKYFPIVITA